MLVERVNDLVDNSLVLSQELVTTAQEDNDALIYVDGDKICETISNLKLVLFYLDKLPVKDG